MHMMKVCVAVTALLMSTSALATKIVLDDFSDDTALLNGNSSEATALANGIDRKVTITTLQNAATTIDPFTAVQGGVFSINMGPGDQAEVSVVWELPDFGLSGAGTFSFLASVSPGFPPPPTLSIFVDGGLFATETFTSPFPAGGGLAEISYNLADVSIFNNQIVEFVFAGGTEFDVQMDDVAISFTDVPEPATLGLFGAGIAALGLASRRRKAAA